ncbi:hypothetical protein CRN52_11525 [Vibrio vulnificus]|uniref:DUF3265 domain-containing protein n=2 Tax=Vibrio vulnificus TaxID=672 RepID=A0A2S3R2W6_VIBVL|nr:hypothetical protein CRN52_11525 [Vibrio vulnificus]
MTKRLSGIHAAWHFWYAVIFGGESGLRKAGLCGIHPLTQRYAANRNNDNKEYMMKVGLKLNEQFTVAKHNIVQVVTFENVFHLALVNGEYLVVANQDKDNSGYYTSELNGSVIEVPVNEYHRIQRELSEYFEVEIKDLSDTKDDSETESQETAA